jgi:glycosyltransferase involved in cell wall biosynthesis
LPLVSIIIATYNRSNILRYTIESVRAQTLTDWELFVIGDACTDDTEATVLQFHDPRIHFYNLPRNVGDQSGPNNEGFCRSTGRYIAWLNHDDLWFPDHLASSVQAIEETGADLVWPLIAKLRTDGVFSCDDLNDQRDYQPHLSIPASYWVLRRDVAEEIGPWRHYSEVHAVPSQNWIYRAYCARKKLRYIPRCTVIGLPSGARPGAYAKRDFEQNAQLLQRMLHEQGFRETMLIEIAEHYSMHLNSAPVWPSVRNTFRDIVRRMLGRYWGWPLGPYTPPVWSAFTKRLARLTSRAGFHPESVFRRFRYRGKGNFVRSLRRLRGLSPDPLPKSNTSQ